MIEFFSFSEAVPLRGTAVPEAVHRPQQPQEARQEPHQGGAGPVQGLPGEEPGPRPAAPPVG